VAVTIASAHEADRATILILRGLIDMNGAAELRAAISAAIGQRPRTIVIDISGIERLDSAAVGTLVVAERLCRELDIDLAVLNRTPATTDHPNRMINAPRIRRQTLRVRAQSVGR
jgi:anti-anti-sigma factor